MEAYSGFAQLYDMYMDQVPYEQWSRRICGLLRAEGICDGLVLDLGCGTGSLTMLLKEAGYDMIGVDGSPEMLMKAREKYQGTDILYLCQDMEELELYGTVGAAVSVCDCLNYLLEDRQLKHVFSLVHNYLDPDGLFIFDMNTPHKYETMGDAVIGENRPDGSFLWENTYDPDSRINEYAVTFYTLETENLYRRFEEFHYQKAYPAKAVTAWLKEAGFEVLGVYDGYTDECLKEDSQRMVVAARAKKGI